MINVLYQPFPDYVEIDGKRYPIITDFREWLRFSALMDSELSNTEKAILMLELYKDKVPDNVPLAIEALGTFFVGYELYGKQKVYSEEEEHTERREEPVYDYEQDSADIYSSFLSCYGIDLIEVQYMHWYKFRILFETLPGDSNIKQKIYYRSVDLNKIKNKEERKRIREIKESIKIIKKRDIQLSDYDIGDVFS